MLPDKRSQIFRMGCAAAALKGLVPWAVMAAGAPAPFGCVWFSRRARIGRSLTPHRCLTPFNTPTTPPRETHGLRRGRRPFARHRITAIVRELDFVSKSHRWRRASSDRRAICALSVPENGIMSTGVEDDDDVQFAGVNGVEVWARVNSPAGGKCTGALPTAHPASCALTK
jgi:hypothetical protein